MSEPQEPTIPHVPAVEPSGDTTHPHENTPRADGDSTPGGGGPPVDPARPAGERYRLGPELARGGMGVVYRAQDLAIGREVAVKVLAPGLAGTDAARRFFEEAQITGRLEHPNIPPIYDLGTLPDARPYLAMKLIRGGTLAEELRKRESPGSEMTRFTGIFEKVCLTVAFAHSRGIIHRDLKPANVMVGAFGEVQVMDWGLAKELRVATHEGVPAGGGPEGPEDRTHVGQVIGTPAYMPPEQAKGELDLVDERADVFALGGILCSILTGKPPYTGTLGWIVMQKAAAADLGEAQARLRDAIDGFAGQPDSDGSASLVGLARRCLHPDRDKRPAHAGEVAALLHSARNRSQQYQRKVELTRAVAGANRKASQARRQFWLALQVGSVVVVLALAAAFIASRPLGDFTAMGVVFGLVFAGFLYFVFLWYRE